MLLAASYAAGTSQIPQYPPGKMCRAQSAEDPRTFKQTSFNGERSESRNEAGPGRSFSITDLSRVRRYRRRDRQRHGRLISGFWIFFFFSSMRFATSLQNGFKESADQWIFQISWVRGSVFCVKSQKKRQHEESGGVSRSDTSGWYLPKQWPQHIYITKKVLSGRAVIHILQTRWAGK